MATGMENITKKLYETIPGMHASIKLLVVFTAVALYFAWIVAPTPEKAAAYIQAQGWSMPPYTEMPQIFWLALNFWTLCLIADALYFSEKIKSDTLLVEGWDHTESCNAGNLMEKGDFGAILGGGVKLLGNLMPGNIVVIAPRTHLFKIGSSIVVEVVCDPPGDLKIVPYELKDAIRSRRGLITGIEFCSVGFLNNTERRTHQTFRPRKYDPTYKGPEELNTEGFITEILKANGHVNLMWEVEDNETQGLRARLSVPAEVARTTMPRDKPQGISKLIFSGE